SGRVAGIGTILTAGAAMTRDIALKNSVMSSPGSARMSSVGLACDGVTFAPTPAFNIVGTTGGRSLEYMVGSVSAGGFWAFFARADARGARHRAAWWGGLRAASRSKYVFVVSFRCIGVPHAPPLATAAARCPPALS